ncbi:MAG: GNAT family N-acetyltransferase [Hyphomonadaceae bacterium]|nr:GNAT family N-acetyltransferase [Hyphomonadaceae bacterium]
MRTQALTGPALHAALPALARLRIAVFRAFPYLYDGAEEYEARYLSVLETAKDAIIVAAFDGDEIVGCATGCALSDHHDDMAAPLAAAGFEPAQMFYCAESVLLPAYRGRGVGHAFFDAREAHARARGYQESVFCAVMRPADHPARPADYRPLDAFWRARGYAPLDGVVSTFSWRDLGDGAESEKPMQVWRKAPL